MEILNSPIIVVIIGISICPVLSSLGLYFAVNNIKDVLINTTSKIFIDIKTAFSVNYNDPESFFNEDYCKIIREYENGKKYILLQFFLKKEAMFLKGMKLVLIGMRLERQLVIHVLLFFITKVLPAHWNHFQSNFKKTIDFSRDSNGRFKILKRKGIFYEKKYIYYNVDNYCF